MKPFAVLTLRKEPHYRRAAFENGLNRLGYTVADSRNAQVTPRGPADLLVMWNKKAGKDEESADSWERRGGTVLVVENAYLQKVDKSSYAISTHGHNGSGWFPVRDEDRFSKLGFALSEIHSGGRYKLVCGQRGIGSRLMASPPQWAEKKVKLLTQQGCLPRLRPHPGNFAPKTPLVGDLRWANECHIWSSGAGVRALVEGVVVVHDAPHWICEGWEFNREAALNRMAHGQWSVAEIESGEPFARMQAEEWGPRTWR